MSDAPLPKPAALRWQDKPILTPDGLAAPAGAMASRLDSLRQVDYVRALEAILRHPGLLVASGFVANPDDPSRITGWLASREDQSTLQFDLLTTASTLAEQHAVLADLRQRFLTR